MSEAMITTFGVVLVAIITSIISPLLTARGIKRQYGKKVDEIHRMTAVNHHSTQPPTILDKLDDIASEQKHVTLRLDRIEGTVGLKPLPKSPPIPPDPA